MAKALVKPESHADEKYVSMSLLATKMLTFPIAGVWSSVRPAKTKISCYLAGVFVVSSIM